ncbi:MBL fold metallo-hydrolase [Vagococcus hydrophili]|uniref:MBL fold metallo-hydrolase n=1 Tax=Vagococcus hydrophili TaxID=2714947 RepID=A0A6G8AQL6_9ENTE|nr:MBL fold metallo-hydrolase [Vagococcus hydrophili]QIL47232.1 MBL fold metallo-hydrolase [Vagococcus hydrophili]
MIKISMLLDNKKGLQHLKSSHGLSIYIEFNEIKLLMDTGPNKNFLTNAETLGINLDNLDGIILSHGHSDHVGGLNYLDLSAIPIHASKHIFNPKFIKILGFNKYVGMPKTIDKTSFNFISEITELFPDVFIMPLNKTKNTTNNLYKSQGQQIVLDDFSDELALVIINNQELTLFTGCSHHGIVEIIKTTKEYFPTQKIKHVIGGFHMIGIPYLNNLGLSKEKIEMIGNELNTLDIDHYYTCHCTGMKAYNILKPILNNKLNYLSTGNTLMID